MVGGEISVVTWDVSVQIKTNCPPPPPPRVFHPFYIQPPPRQPPPLAPSALPWGCNENNGVINGCWKPLVCLASAYLLYRERGVLLKTLSTSAKRALWSIKSWRKQILIITNIHYYLWNKHLRSDPIPFYVQSSSIIKRANSKETMF